MNLLLALSLAFVQPDTLSLDWCYREAEAQFPLSREIGLHDEAADHQIKSLQSRYLPQLALRGDATYQSEVPTFDSFPDAFEPPVISHDQYHVTLGAEQLIYDGGLTGAETRLALAEATESQQKVRVELYELRDRVSQAYFNVLLQQAQLATLASFQTDVEARLEMVRSQVEQGVLLRSNADVLEVELLSISQQRVEADKRRRAALDVLSEFVGRPLGSETVLEVPSARAPAVILDPKTRPEYGLFEQTRSTIQERIGLTARANHPRVSAFGDASYGRFPGLNMFENDFTPYYAVGVRLSWKLWDWNANRRRRQALSVQQDIVEARQAAFSKNIQLALKQQIRDVERLEELISRDEEIIALRRRIVQQSESQLKNGVITATEYLLERNAAHRAELTRERHRIQLAQVHAQIRTTIGDSND
jgi:outer membrane protein TolC